MKTFNQLVADKTVKRADSMRARLQDIRIEDGFNWRDDGEDLEAYVRELADSIIKGDILPDVWLDADLVVREGHCRINAYRLAEQTNPGAMDRYRDKEGVIWLPFKPFSGTELEANALVVKSQDNRKLSPIELAKGYRRMSEMGASNDDIAKLVNKSRGHVDQMLLLASAPTAVHEAVSNGEIAATEAVKLVREHRENSAEVLAERKEAQQGKVTAKSATPKPRKASDDQLLKNLVDATRGFSSTIDAGTKERIQLGTLDYVEVRADFLAEILMAIDAIPGEE